VIAIPPRKDAALSANYQNSPTTRDHNILFAEEYSKYRWQDFSQDLPAQKIEAKIGCLMINKMT
jgi:hypothetical protein